MTLTLSAPGVVNEVTVVKQGRSAGAEVDLPRLCFEGFDAENVINARRLASGGALTELKGR